ncbi:MAG: hypothetical protein H6741_08685 [Alphaproteobacteria bacterium]|nr:hypothetical protein [Alphaproteobacteria bacterium]
MAGASRQARRLLDELKKQGVEKLPEQLAGEDQELAALDQEIGPDRARALQAQTGNQALQNILRRSGRLDGQGTDLEIEVEEEGQEQEGQELEETGPEEANLETSFAAALSSSDVGAAGASYDDQEAEWDIQYGGDGEPDAAPEAAPRREFRRTRNRRLPMRRDKKGVSAEEIEEELAELDLPPLARPEDPQGDEQMDALWGWLTDPAVLARAALEPEDLDPCPPPLARCVRMGGYLARAARDPLARGLGALTGPLPGGPGLASMVARAGALATVAGLIEAEEASIDTVNKAATLALEDDAVEHGRRAAHRCVKQRRLAAHFIFAEATKDLPPPQGDLPGKRPRPGRRAMGLLNAAIEEVVRPGPIPLAARMPRPSGGDDTADAATAEVDALLRSLTGALEPEGPERIGHETIAPLVHGIENLVNAAGRAQIEIAAAAIAVERATSTTLRRRISGLLKASDHELRSLARDAIGAGQALQPWLARPLDDAWPAIAEAEQRISAVRERLSRVRESSFAALGAFALVSEEAGAR